MKKRLSIVLGLMLATSLLGCQSNEGANSQN